MGNDDQLEVGVGPLQNQVAQGVGQRLDILPVEVGGGLVEGDDPAVGAERLGQCQPDDQRGQDLLTRRAPTPHFELSVVLLHDHPVVVVSALVGTLGHGFVVVVGLDLDVVDIVTPIQDSRYNELYDFIYYI